uniref:Uncharacterized protein n=1 Tax=Siphoviridae sp. ctxMM9 TaxID=2827973 RepID=A0A8S5T7K6_9CAUD|nr:MAG TPA: hypothetical protein [Siphoviridae sp. ctxMM9]
MKHYKRKSEMLIQKFFHLRRILYQHFRMLTIMLSAISLRN